MAVMAGLTTLQMIGLGLSATSAIGQIQAGRAQAQAYQRQARMETLKAKRAEIQYKEQGVEVLRRLRQNLGTVTARAASGGLDPYSGTAQGIKDYGTRLGVREYYMTEENAALSLAAGDINAAQYNSAASQARRQGLYSAIGTMGMAVASVGTLGAAPKTPEFTLNPFGGNATAGYVGQGGL